MQGREVSRSSHLFYSISGSPSGNVVSQNDEHCSSKFEPCKFCNYYHWYKRANGAGVIWVKFYNT
ncbi:hypothetical protein M0657_010870 [Pyricularia oryzae]|nr:hypothetical protein M9X92_011066 [Pyricularia oryzae]KAI7911594.1 hypothetical protein M0657_010870 [Pyricularia oryzae]